MGARQKPAKGCVIGNFVSEWFGHEVWPKVSTLESVIVDQMSERCPFLSDATGSLTKCVKSGDKRARRTGVCVISSDSNGTRENWLACPFRLLDREFTLFRQAITLLFGINDPSSVEIFSIEKLRMADGGAMVKDALELGKRCFVFSATKLGGEIDLPETKESPGTKVDVSIIEVTDCTDDGVPSEFGKHLFFEIQTADFHGSPLHAVGGLENLLRSEADSDLFHSKLAEDIEIAGTGVEGPNKSNVFKRTFYQTALKISIAEADGCAGFVLAIPTSVWESWRKHLADPQLIEIPDSKGWYAILASDEQLDQRLQRGKSWIFVFDIDDGSRLSPRPLTIKKRILISTKALQEHAFTRAAESIVRHNVVSVYRKTFETRIVDSWKPKRLSKSKGGNTKHEREEEDSY